MRVSLLLVSLVALASALSGVAASSGSWGVFADSGCSISLYSSTFVSGACGAQSSGSTTIYYITTCNADGTWVEQEYSDVKCTTIAPNSKMTGNSGACFANGQYFGKVVCPSSSKKMVAAVQPAEASVSIVDAIVPASANSAAAASGSLLALAVAAVMALFA